MMSPLLATAENVAPENADSNEAKIRLPERKPMSTLHIAPPSFFLDGISSIKLSLDLLL